MVCEADEGLVEEGVEDVGGGAFGLAALGALASGEADEGLADFRDGGEEGEEALHVARPAAVPEGVEVAGLGAGAGAAASSGHLGQLPSFGPFGCAPS